MFVEHPQANEQVEAANKVIIKSMKKSLDKAKSSWPNKLKSILWAYHTIPHSGIRESPFRLTYGVKAMISLEVGEPMLRVKYFLESNNK